MGAPLSPPGRASSWRPVPAGRTAGRPAASGPELGPEGGRPHG